MANISKDDFSSQIDNLKTKIGDQNGAIISEDLLSTKSAYNGLYDENEQNKAEIEKLKNENEELLKVNGKLYQKIGMEDINKQVTKVKVSDEEEKPKKTDISTLINEKGDFI